MKLLYVVPSEKDGTILQDLLRREVGLSSQVCRQVKRMPGALRVDGRAMYTNQRVRAGMRIEIVIPEKTPEKPPEARGGGASIRICYEDDALLCVDKPSGIVCHPTPGLARGEETMLERVAAYLGYTPHPVHRLDRGTSGIWIVAKNAYVQSRLVLLEKTYEAVCFGAPPAQHGVIDAPILTRPDDARRRIDPAGQSARTHYTVLKSGQGMTCVQLRIETGRTHQIRVHLASVGCPVMGDRLYGTEASMALAGQKGIERLLLNACGAVFLHPATGERVTVECPMRRWRGEAGTHDGDVRIGAEIEPGGNGESWR